jgi:hypothetical protein
MWVMSDKMETRQSHLGGLVEHSEEEGRESVVAILMFLCCSPRMCRLRTEGLVPVNKYWMYHSHASDMGPVSLVVCCQKMFGFLHCFIGWLERENGYGPADRSTDVLWIVSGVISLGSGDSWKVAMYGDRPQEAYTGRMWTGIESVCIVLVGFSPAGCTSIRIIVTLGYD